MSKRRFVLLAICMTAPCLALLILLRLNERKDRITWENIERIQIGTTEAEVEAIFGVPRGNYNATFAFTADDSFKTWVGDGPGVNLRFDADGKVTEVRRLAVPKEMNHRRSVVRKTHGWMDCLFDKLAE